MGIDHGVFCVIDEVFSSRFFGSLDEEFCLGESRSGVRKVFVWKLGGQMRLRALGDAEWKVSVGVLLIV